jgi:hypothetical protein
MAISAEASELVENFHWLIEEQTYALNLAHKDQQDNIFKGFGGYIDTPKNILGVFLMDKVTRARGMYGSCYWFKINLDLYLEHRNCH